MSDDAPRWEESYDDEQEAGIPAFLLDPIGVVRRRWLPAAMVAALGLVGTVVAAILWVPTYSSIANILISSQQIPKEFVRSTVETDDLANINAMLGEVLSVRNLSNLIDRHNLFADADPETPRAALVKRMRDKIEAAPQGSLSSQAQALVFELSYESRDPKEAADIANALATLFVEASLKRRTEQAGKATKFLRGEMERADKELKEITRQITEYRREHRGELPDEQDARLRKIDVLAVQRESLSTQIGTKEDRILSMSSQTDDTVLSEDEIVLGELRRKLADESAVNTDEHPNVIALRHQIDRLEQLTGDSSRLSPTVQRMIEGERREIERMRDQRARIDAEIADLNVRIDRTPLIAEDLAELERKEAVLREDFVESMRKVQEAELAESLESAQQGGQVSILDRAAPPTSPNNSLALIVLAGLVGSLGAAVGIAVLLELLDPVLVGTRQIEKLGNGPVLGSVPHVA